MSKKRSKQQIKKLQQSKVEGMYPTAGDNRSALPGAHAPGNVMKVVDESFADQCASLASTPGNVNNHKQQPVDRDAMQPIGNKCMQGGKYN